MSLIKASQVFAFVLGLLCIVASPSIAQDAVKETKAEVTEVAAEKAADHSDSHGHGAHPTGANMSDVGEDPSEWRTEKAIATFIVFLLLLAGLYGAAWKPISEGLEKREKSIAGNIAAAEKASKEASDKLAQYEAKLAAAAQEATQIVAEARRDAEAAGQRLINEAQEEASRQRARALDEIEAAKRVALGELAERSTEVAMTLAQRIVGREVRAEDHQGFIQDMLAKLPSKN
ncbi:MAG: F0F1 ATP synthase subunit B [Pirellulales bacterium]